MELEEPTWKPIKVILKETQEEMIIKDSRFNPELHELIKKKTKPKKSQKKPVEKSLDLERLRMADLYEMAKDRELKVKFGMKKTDLIKLLEK